VTAADHQSTSGRTGQRSGLGPRKTLLICIVLLLAGAVALLLIFNTEPVEQRESAVRESAMLVEVTPAEAGDFRPLIHAVGTVVPAQEIMLRPRVGGEIVEISAAFVPGGYVQAGDVLLRLDPADYRNALRQRESELQQAIAELEIEHGRQDIAERDYRQLDRELDAAKRALVLREPQLRSAEARVQAARVALEQAQLDLERTTVRAPFGAQVLSRQVNLGSQVSSGDALARLVGLDTYWVETTVPLDRLRWLIFARDGSQGGSPVTVRHRTAWPDGQQREGYLYQLIGELEGDTRLARVLVAVDDPLGRASGDGGQPGLIIGSFVECLIEGREIRDAVRLDRDHLRKNDTVWLMRDGKLAVQPVDIVFRDAEHVYIRNGIAAGEQVVTSSLATVRDGVRLRIKAAADASDAAAVAPAGGELAGGELAGSGQR
jgi:RND family efflux transporter MFP subunit